MVAVHFPVSVLMFGGSEHKPNASESSGRRIGLSLSEGQKLLSHRITVVLMVLNHKYYPLE